MPLITWSSMLSVGIKEIDDQHQVLIGLVNEVNDAMQAGKGRDVLGKVLDELVNYTVYHFGTEEKLMAAHSYPQSADHIAEHVKLVEEVGAFKGRFESGNAMITTELMNFLRDWLTKHILQTDKAFGKHLKAHGVH